MNNNQGIGFAGLSDLSSDNIDNLRKIEEEKKREEKRKLEEKRKEEEEIRRKEEEIKKEEKRKAEEERKQKTEHELLLRESNKVNNENSQSNMGFSRLSNLSLDNKKNEKTTEKESKKTEPRQNTDNSVIKNNQSNNRIISNTKNYPKSNYDGSNNDDLKGIIRISFITVVIFIIVLGVVEDNKKQSYNYTSDYSYSNKQSSNNFEESSNNDMSYGDSYYKNRGKSDSEKFLEYANSTNLGLKYQIKNLGSLNKVNYNDKLDVRYKIKWLDRNGYIYKTDITKLATWTYDDVPSWWFEGMKLIGEGGKIELYFSLQSITFKDTGKVNDDAFLIEIEIDKIIKPESKKEKNKIENYVPEVINNNSDEEVLSDKEAFLEFSKTTSSGLKYKIINQGSYTNRVNDSNDKAKVSYKIKWLNKNGDVYYTTNTSTTTWYLNKIATQWFEGIKLIGEGGKIELYFPANSITYQDIRKSNSDAFFIEIKLNKVIKAENNTDFSNYTTNSLDRYNTKFSGEEVKKYMNIRKCASIDCDSLGVIPLGNKVQFLLDNNGNTIQEDGWIAVSYSGNFCHPSSNNCSKFLPYTTVRGWLKFNPAFKEEDSNKSDNSNLNTRILDSYSTSYYGEKLHQYNSNIRTCENVNCPSLGIIPANSTVYPLINNYQRITAENWVAVEYSGHFCTPESGHSCLNKTNSRRVRGWMNKNTFAVNAIANEKVVKRENTHTIIHAHIRSCANVSCNSLGVIPSGSTVSLNINANGVKIMKGNWISVYYSGESCYSEDSCLYRNPKRIVEGWMNVKTLFSY